MIDVVERCPWCGSKITHDKFVKVQDAIRKDEQNKLAALEKTVKDRLAKEIAAEQQKLLKERQAIVKQVELAKQEAEKARRREIADIRQILQKDRDAALLKKEAEFARERDALQKKIVAMSRRVGKSAGDVAEGGEIDTDVSAIVEAPSSPDSGGRVLRPAAFRVTQ